MTGLREPVSKWSALLLVASALAYLVARTVAGPLTSAQVILVLLALEFIIQPLSTLVHECGHAIVARRVSSGPVSVIVGRGPYLSGTIGAVRLNFSLLPGRGVQVRGLCRYDPAHVSWRHRAAVSLAGPAATCLELLGATVTTVAVWSTASPVVRNLLLLTAIGLIVSLVVNLIPNTIIPGVVANDGSNALQAIRNDRAGVAARSRRDPPRRRPPRRTFARWLAQRRAFPRHRRGADAHLRAIIGDPQRTTESARTASGTGDRRLRDRRASPDSPVRV